LLSKIAYFIIPAMLDKNVNFKNKFSFISLGCARNLVDSEVMIGILLKNGYEVTQSPEEADFHVINTCGFLESSRQEGLNTIAEVFRSKKADAKVIVAGCMVQKHNHLLKENFPNIHYMLGSGDVEKILDAVRSGDQGEAVTSAKSYLEWGEVPRTLSTPKHYAYLKIAEGCKKRCAFCIIPTIKGPLKSKTTEQVAKEFNALLSQGVFEIILIAQDLGDFGRDRKEKGALAALLRELLKVQKDFWIRLLYLYPDEIDDELISIMKSDSRICPYLDMPIQHINDEVLKAMHRTTSKEQIVTTIEKLRREIPGVVIRTSLMVGFPGETEEQFKELLQFVQKTQLDNVGIFKFSLEKEAYAAKLPNQISEEIKQDRYERLAAAQQKAVQKRSQNLIGKKVKAIVEGFHPESEMLLRARYSGQCPEIDGQIIINDGRKVTAFGNLYEVEITQVAGYDLVGRVLGPVSTPKSAGGRKLALV
jgi:ribosomal protein S12 methylthiotransferase